MWQWYALYRTEVWWLTLSSLIGDQQEVAVEAEEHGQAGVELSQGGALHEGLESDGHWGQGEAFHILTWKGQQ